jgi:aspartyl/asparaginyl beta-hydroxylase (cupin superfamily)
MIYCICFILILLLIIIIYCNHNNKLSKNYYEVEEICPELNLIYNDIESINNEVNNISKEKWMDWPEKYLYKYNENGKQQRNNQWRIFPFVGLGVINEENCKKCPKLWSFLRKIPNLKLATLSRLSAGTN